MFPAVSDCPTEPAISRKVPLSLGSPRKVRSIPKAFVIVPLDFTSCNKSAYQPFILSRGYLFRYLRSRLPPTFTNSYLGHESALELPASFASTTTASRPLVRYREVGRAHV